MSQLEENDHKEGILDCGSLCEIIPNSRIESLKQFYVSSILNEAGLVDEPVPSGLSEGARGSWATKKLKEADLVDETVVPSGLSEGARGSWAMKKLYEVAVAFNVQYFIECDEKGGDELPIIEDLEEYDIAHKKLKAKSMTERARNRKNCISKR